MFKIPVENRKSKADFNAVNASGCVASTSDSSMDDQQWDSEADTLALTQLSKDIEDKFRNKGAIVRELPKAPKRDFTPCFAPGCEGGSGLNNTKFIGGGNDSSSKEEIEFLSQDVRTEVERLRKILSLKEGENKILRDSKEEEAKKHQETLRQYAAIIETLKKDLIETKQADRNEREALASKIKFLEQELEDLERKFKHEKAIRKKAESDIQSVIVSSENEVTTPLTRANAARSRNAVGCVSTKESSQFPCKNDFFSPSQAAVENGKENKRRKRNTTPNKAASKRFNAEGCGGGCADVISAPAPKTSATFPAADESVQTETPPRIKRRFVMTPFLKERRNPYWYVDVLLHK